jgi:membrane protein required for colicin V production
MNWLDIVIIIVLIVSVFSGLKNGIIKSVLSLAGLIIGVVLAGRYYLPLAEKLSIIPHEGATKIIAFVIILGVVMTIFWIIGELLTKVISAIMLGWVNRLGGAILGVVLGGISCGAALAIWVKFMGMAGAIADSAIAPVLINYFPVVLSLLPSEFDPVRSFFK